MLQKDYLKGVTAVQITSNGYENTVLESFEGSLISAGQKCLYAYENQQNNDYFHYSSSIIYTT